MHRIGHKLEVPKRDDVRGWEMFYDQITAPGHGGWFGGVSEERHRENEHWEGCRIRLKESGSSTGGSGGPSGAPGGGCERCAKVEERLPKHGLGWRWNDVLR
jgi:hypothetical protein